MNRSKASRLAWNGLASFVITFLAANVTYGTPVVLGSSLSPLTTLLISVFIVVATTFALLILDIRHYLLYWLHLVLLQNVVTGIWFSDTGGEVPLVITEAKTISIILAFLLCSGRILKFANRDRWLILGGVLYIAGLAVNLTDFSLVALATLRNFVTPLATLLVAVSFVMSFGLHKRIQFLRSTLYIVAFWLATGAMGEHVVGTTAWRNFFNAYAMGGLNSLSEETSILGIPLPRIGGFLLEPVNAGYMAASVLVVLLVIRSLERKSHSLSGDLVCAAASLFSLVSAATKNGLMMFFIAFLAYLLLSRRVSRPKTVLICWGSAFAVTLGYTTIVKGFVYLFIVFRDPVGASGGESTSIHMAGLLSGFQGLMDAPLGHGLGTGGNFLKVFDPTISRSEWLSTGSESAWGTLAYQSGILCVIGLVVILLRMAKRLGPGATLLLAVWSSAALFAESFFGPIASSVLLIATAFLAVSGSGISETRRTRGFEGTRRHASTAQPSRRSSLYAYHRT
jgi:hypothetical protein